MASQQKPKQKQKNNLSFEKELSIWCIQFKRSSVNMIFKQATFWPNNQIRLNQTKKHL